MDNALTDRLHSIQQKLNARAIALEPCWRADDIAKFEAKWQAQLPEDYREFLLHVGDGGPGPPDYGMVGMGDVPDDYDETADEVNAKLARPFPLTKYWVWEDDPEADKAAIAQVRQGGLILGNDGCGMYWMLIVTGSQRGEMWQITGEGAQPCAPPRDFLSWYEYWLDGGRDWWADFQP